MSKRIVGLLALACLYASRAGAASCGTVAAPTACSITVGGSVTYAFTAFSLVTANATGGGILYGGADIAIDVATGGGLTAVLTFSKVSNASGIVFLANSGEVSSFTVSYTATISPVSSGSVAYTTPFVVAIPLGSRSGNGSGTAQFVVPGAPVCVAIVGISQGTCTIPGGQPLALGVGDIVNLSGNSGNVSIGNFTNLFDVAFTSPVELLEFQVD